MKRYYLYIDDSGIRYPDREPVVKRADGMDYFALGGILIEDKDRAALGAAHSALCDRWGIDYPLHSTAIRGRRNKFAWLGEDRDREIAFLADLELFLVGLPVIGFATVIDRPGYNDRYKEKYGDQRWWMCKTAFSVLIERVTKYVMKNDGTLSIRFEESGKREDRAIIGYAKDLKRSGSPFDAVRSVNYDAITPEEYKRVIEGDPERVTKKSPSVQVADIYLYPMVKHGYDSGYRPWHTFMSNKRLIDSHLHEDERPKLGVKYSCFDNIDKRKAR